MPFSCDKAGKIISQPQNSVIFLDEFKREVRKVDRWIESLQLLLDRQPPPDPPPWGGLEVSFRNPAFGPQLPGSNLLTFNSQYLMTDRSQQKLCSRVF